MSSSTNGHTPPNGGSAAPTGPGTAAPALVGDELGGTIEVDYKLHTPHPQARKRQRVQYPELVADAVRKKAEREGVDYDPADADREVERSLAAAAARRLNIASALDEVQPVSTVRPADEVDRSVETAAVLRLPLLLWAWARLTLHTSGPKNIPMWRALAAAVGMHMGFAPVFPCASRILGNFCRKLSTEAWEHRYPGEPPSYRDEQGGKWELSAFHKQLKLVFGLRNPFGMWKAINRDLILSLLGQHTVHPKKGGQFANVPDALKYLLVDAVLIEADLPQSKPVSSVHARIVRGEARSRAGYVVYRVGTFITKHCHGYKWLQVSSLLLGGLVLHGKLLPANCDERAETITLLDELFEMWPELRDQKDIVLVGDALYDQSEDFAYELVFRFGIHPCFPRSGTIGRTHAHHDTGGVPKCGCGELAVLDEADKFPTPHWRRTHGKPDAGHWMFNARAEPIDNARLRWKCARRVGGCRAPDTYPRENARLYTWLPHAGNHHRAALRTALCAYRNVIESTFATLKNMGLAGRAQTRPRWAGDDQMDHLCWMAATTMSARRLVHENGLYEQVLEEARADGLMRAPTATDRQGPTNLTEAQALAQRQAWKRWAKAPSGWPELDPDTDEFHEPADDQLTMHLST